MPNRTESAGIMIEKLFPYKQEEDLKIYAVLSVHNQIAPTINDTSTKLLVIGAYTLDEALRENENILRGMLPTTYWNWRMGIMVNLAPYQHLVPPNKVVEMVDKIKADQTPTQPELMARETAQLEAYCRFVFDKAKATSYEKGILTSVLKRFIQNISLDNHTC